jgi:hypothetical protein
MMVILSHNPVTAMSGAAFGVLTSRSAADEMTAYPAVSNARNQGPQCIQPVPGHEEAPQRRLAARG